MTIKEFAEIYNVDVEDIYRILDTHQILYQDDQSLMTDEAITAVRESGLLNDMIDLFTNIESLSKKIYIKLGLSLLFGILCIGIFTITDSIINPLSMMIPSLIVVISIGFLISFYFYKQNNPLSESEPHIHFKGLKKRYTMVDMFYVIPTFFLVIFVIVGFIVTPTYVSGPSMEPTLVQNDQLLIWNPYNNIERFDVVVLDIDEENYYYNILEPGKTHIPFVKRVIAIPGDYIEYKDNNLYINNVLVEEPYLENEDGLKLVSTQDFTLEDVCVVKGLENPCDTANGFVIPEGFYFAMGDNRPYSTDSRLIGLIKEEDIIGKVVIRMLPLETFGIIH